MPAQSPESYVAIRPAPVPNPEPRLLRPPRSQACVNIMRSTIRVLCELLHVRLFAKPHAEDRPPMFLDRHANLAKGLQRLPRVRVPGRHRLPRFRCCRILACNLPKCERLAHLSNSGKRSRSTSAVFNKEASSIQWL